MLYEVENKELNIIIKNIRIPSYQRNYVWDNKRQVSLIISLILKYPIGVLTAYKENDKYVILDGLQRVTTIKNFQENPSKVLKFKELKKILDLNFENLTKTKECDNIIENYFKVWYENLKNIENVENDTADFQEEYLLKLKGKINKEDLKKKEIREEYKKIIRNIKFLDVKVPVILCLDYSDNELADVFEKMNSGSMKLSKYEVFVAQWNEYGKILFSNDLSSKINVDINKRSSYLREKFNINIKTQSNNSFYLHEYFLTLSTMMNEMVFYKRNDSYGYEIISLLLINKVYGVNKLVNDFFVENYEFKTKLSSFLEELYHVLKETLIDISDIIKDEKEKFAKYFRIINHINCKYIINLEEYKIIRRNINEEKVREIDTIEHKFEFERQISYLQNEIQEVRKKYFNEIKEEKREKVKILNLTETFIDNTENKLRIQVRPIVIKHNVERNNYNEVFGLYEEIYVKFNLNSIITSNAIRKSLYVDKEEIIKFKDSPELYEKNLKSINSMCMMKRSYFNKLYVEVK